MRGVFSVRLRKSARTKAIHNVSDDTYKNKFGHRFDNIIESDYRGTIGIALRQSIIALPRTRKRSVNKVWPFLTILKKLYIHANNYMLNYHSNAIPEPLRSCINEIYKNSVWSRNTYNEVPPKRWSILHSGFHLQLVMLHHFVW